MSMQGTLHGTHEGYDLIGDVHGCGATLGSLLERLGYHQRGGVYRHPRRKVIFLGDLIDRGPRIRLAVSIARRMVEAGEAHIVMGNHEYNALAYCHRAPAGMNREWLREHTPRHNRIIRETLEQYRDHPYYQDWLSNHFAPICGNRVTLMPNLSRSLAASRVWTCTGLRNSAG